MTCLQNNEPNDCTIIYDTSDIATSDIATSDIGNCAYFDLPK